MTTRAPTLRDLAANKNLLVGCYHAKVSLVGVDRDGLGPVNTQAHQPVDAVVAATTTTDHHYPWFGNKALHRRGVLHCIIFYLF